MAQPSPIHTGFPHSAGVLVMLSRSLSHDRESERSKNAGLDRLLPHRCQEVSRVRRAATNPGVWPFVATFTAQRAVRSSPAEAPWPMPWESSNPAIGALKGSERLDPTRAVNRIRCCARIYAHRAYVAMAYIFWVLAPIQGAGYTGGAYPGHRPDGLSPGSIAGHECALKGAREVP